MIKYQVTCYLAHHLSPKTDHFLHQQLQGNHSLQTGLVCPLTDPAACFIKKKNTELIHSSRQDSMHSCGNLNFGQQSILPKILYEIMYLLNHLFFSYLHQSASKWTMFSTSFLFSTIQGTNYSTRELSAKS